MTRPLKELTDNSHLWVSKEIMSRIIEIQSLIQDKEGKKHGYKRIVDDMSTKYLTLLKDMYRHREAKEKKYEIKLKGLINNES